MSVVPTTCEDWKYCITETCGIPLTASYVADRIAALSNSNDFHTQKFIERWGPEHLARTIEWFNQAARELEGAS